MRAIYKAPGKDPQTVEIENTLSVLQQIVGGYIETVRISDNGILIMNEEGKLLGLEPNFYLGAIGDTIVGPVLIVGENGDEFADLPADEADEIERILKEASKYEEDETDRRRPELSENIRRADDTRGGD